jgi:DNA-binding SARP family transcriptional activator
VIQFGVLGPLTVHANGRAVRMPALMPRLLLAVLLSQAGRPISAERLADALWDGAPPATARKTLQVYVHRLRQTLDDAARIQHGNGAYWIQVSSAEFDALRFTDLVGQARAARDDGRPTAADELFRQALSLWQAEPRARRPAG